MTWKKAMLGGFIVAGIYVVAFLGIIVPIVMGIDMYHAHPIAAIAMLVIWAAYFLFISYIFSAYKLLDMRWTTMWVRNFLERNWK